METASGSDSMWFGLRMYETSTKRRTARGNEGKDFFDSGEKRGQKTAFME